MRCEQSARKTTTKCKLSQKSANYFHVVTLKARPSQNIIFPACKTVLGARPCTGEILQVKEQVCTLLILTWWGDRNFTKLVLKSLEAKNGLSISVLYITPFLQIVRFQFTWWLLSILVHYLINWNDKRCSECSIWTMDSCCLHTLKYHYLFEGCKVLSIRLRKIY